VSFLPAALLLAAAALGWPTYGGTYANTRHVDVAQINARNVASLRLAWTFSTGVYGQFETSPIVVGDTLYFTTGLTNMVYALDATRGTLRWRFAPHVGPAPYIEQVNRGVAVDGGRVFVATLDDQLIALDARSGKPQWNVRVGDPREGLTETMAPLAWNGLVFIGSSGGEYGIRGSFSAYAQSNGHLVWRWWSVSPGWEGPYVSAVHGISLHRDLARERRSAPRYRDAWRHGGGPVWMTPALSPADGTIYLSTGNPAPNFNGDARPGDNLYTDSIVALDARSGTMRWYYQETPHDLWDYDAASPPVLFDARDARGRRVPAVGEAGKTGWFFILDRRTGAELRISQPFIPQTHIFAAPSPQGHIVQPGEGGGAIGPVAYDPQLHAIFVAGTVARELVKQDRVVAWRSGMEWQAGSQDWVGHGYALVSRIDVDTGRIAWQRRVANPVVGGELSARDVVFLGEEGTGAFDALDARSGQLLWQVKPAGLADAAEGSFPAALHRAWLTAGRVGTWLWMRARNQPPTEQLSDEDIHAPPIAYVVDGREYVVVAADRPYSTLHPNAGDTLYAFTLPQAGTSAP
jgi:PQQ-dependent dehydrogenase (methanol/ethanol family)